MMFGRGEKNKGRDLRKRPERIEIQTSLNETFTAGSGVLKVKFVTFQENFNIQAHVFIKEILSYL